MLNIDSFWSNPGSTVWAATTEELKDSLTNGDSKHLFYLSNAKTASAMVSAWFLYCNHISLFIPISNNCWKISHTSTWVSFVVRKFFHHRALVLSPRIADGPIQAVYFIFAVFYLLFQVFDLLFVDYFHVINLSVSFPIRTLWRHHRAVDPWKLIALL